MCGENESTGWWGDGTFESRERRHWNWGEVTGMGWDMGQGKKEIKTAEG